MLFTDYSSTFNTIVPSMLKIKLGDLDLNPAMCNWVLDFLMGRPEVGKVGNNISTSLILITGTQHAQLPPQPPPVLLVHP
jgi:hypothetical protein